MHISYEVVRENFDYDPETGVFSPKAFCRYRARVSSGGYLRISWLGTQILVHRAIWLWMTGSLPPPEMQVDHIDRDKLNNRWINLRLVTCLENNRNKTEANSTSKSGIRGISLMGNGRYRVRVFSNGKQHNLGYFATLEEAKTARSRALELLHG